MSPPQKNGFVLFILTLLAIALCCLVVFPFLSALTWALALAIFSQPLLRWIQRRVGKRRNLAALLAVVIIVLAIIGPLILVGNSIVREAAGVADMLETDEWKQKPPFHWLQSRFDVEQELRNALESLRARAGRMLKSVVGFATDVAMTVFILFFFLRDQDVMIRALRQYLPLSKLETDLLLKSSWATVHATVNGTLVVAAVQGALGGLMFWILGLPAPMLWGFAMTVLSVIPILGAFIIWAPAAAVLVQQGDLGKAVILTAWGTVVVGFIDNLLYPMIVGRDMRLHTLPVLIVMIGGLMIFGSAGIILGPLLLALTLALLEIWRLRANASEPAPTSAESRP